MMGDGGTAGCRAVGVLFIVGMDGAAVGGGLHSGQTIINTSLSYHYVTSLYSIYQFDYQTIPCTVFKLNMCTDESHFQPSSTSSSMVSYALE